MFSHFSLRENSNSLCKPPNQERKSKKQFKAAVDPARKQFQAPLRDPRARLPGLKAEKQRQVPLKQTRSRSSSLNLLLDRRIFPPPRRFIRRELVHETSGISLELRALQEPLSITSITAGGVSSSDTRTSSLDHWN